MSTINNRIKTDKNCRIIDIINYIGDILRDNDMKLYAQFVEESFTGDENETLEIIYIKLLEKLKHLKF
jgi:hypothetical protein